jgi:hypothetical protein
VEGLRRGTSGAAPGTAGKGRSEVSDLACLFALPCRPLLGYWALGNGQRTKDKGQKTKDKGQMEEEKEKENEKLSSTESERVTTQWP